ncbi:MAG: flagellar hook-basal body complex protein, partial [Lachnospiraceae bacterium]|nr:flagellar hook-basal body complex protein [Lachnospiraceae bacterium]
MMRSLFSGVAGLKTHQTKMDVIGNNIANVNTVAFKYSSTSFQDIMYQTMSGASGATATKGGKNPNQIGLGVTTGATKVTITKSGAAQSTGDALDIRLSDANSTNFFIVNNGSENVFTRSGSFYVDGNGNLAMTSTGYLVQGWQVDPTTGAIQRDTVSSLRIMSPENMTSEPEKTSEATISGVLDKNDVNVTSTDGYATTLVFYDELGYAYTARFSIKSGLDETVTSGNSTTTSKNGYTIKLTNIYSNSQKDAAGNPIDILETYLNDAASSGTDAEAKAKAKTEALASIFGHVNENGESDGKQTDSFKLNAPTFSLQGDLIAYNYGGKTYTAKIDDVVKAAQDKAATVSFTNTDEKGTTSTVNPNLVDMFKGLGTSLTNYNDNAISPTYTFDKATMMLKATYGAVNYNVMFNSSDGT